jgi:hypothetical protein
MGIGYDSVELALQGEFAIGLLLLLLIGKLLATSLCIGLGVPGGVIGPALFIGAMLGAMVAELAMLASGGQQGPVGVFVLLGMGAMMAGSLQAPLAALTAMLELSDSPAVILPGMLAVVVAGITATELFGKDSLFLTMLRASGVDYGANPVFQALRRIGVASAMDRSFARVEAMLSTEQAHRVLEDGPRYLLIDVPDGQQMLMPAVDLARYLQALKPETAPAIDLEAIPAARWQLAPIELHASLQEAWLVFEEHAAEALLVRRMTAPGIYHVYGILTRDSVERAYRP